MEEIHPLLPKIAIICVNHTFKDDNLDLDAFAEKLNNSIIRECEHDMFDCYSAQISFEDVPMFSLNILKRLKYELTEIGIKKISFIVDIIENIDILTVENSKYTVRLSCWSERQSKTPTRKKELIDIIVNSDRITHQAWEELLTLNRSKKLGQICTCYA